MSNLVLEKVINVPTYVPRVVIKNKITKIQPIEDDIQVKPFIKWAGGKTALLDDIRKFYPKELGTTIKKYCEPFVGGGAVLFDVLSNYNIDEVYISDVNKELVNVYETIKTNVDELINILDKLQSEYLPLDTEKRKEYYYNKRDEFNSYISKQTTEKVYGSALFIFLNRTCFNGLYRVNSKGLYNVPTGVYKNPRICDKKNLINISKKLKNVKIVCAEYHKSIDFIDENTLVYFDPPYRPLTETASFTAYDKSRFGDKEQTELAEYFKKVSEKGAVAILSNSDPKNTNEDDNFFDDLYADFNINRIKSKRRINSNASKRGNVSEILVSNIIDIEKAEALQMARVFEDWLNGFRKSIASYNYYTDFEKVYANVEKIKVELNILNSLIGSKNIEQEFMDLIAKYPETLKCIPILLAVRAKEVYAVDADGEFTYSFKKLNYTPEQYAIFMRKTGLFGLLEEHIVNNLYDYATGVETGLGSNGRKNRGGHLMEDLVESFIVKAGFKKGKNYFKEMYIHEIQSRWDIDLSEISNQGKMEKRFDYVVKTDNQIYIIETNFYASGGSKLNETSRSYKTIAQEVDRIDGVTFVWFTDGEGWKSAKRNLEETFDVMEHIYNINDMKNGVMKEVFK